MIITIKINEKLIISDAKLESLELELEDVLIDILDVHAEDYEIKMEKGND